MSCPVCGSDMVRFYVKDWSSEGRGKDVPAGYYCRHCGYAISDRELRRRGMIVMR